MSPPVFNILPFPKSYVRAKPELQPSIDSKNETWTIICLLPPTPDAIGTHLHSQFPLLIFHTHALSIICHFRNWDKNLVGIIRIYSPCVGPLGEKITKTGHSWFLLSKRRAKKLMLSKIWKMGELWLRKLWAWPLRPRVGTDWLKEDVYTKDM